MTGREPTPWVCGDPCPDPNCEPGCCAVCCPAKDRTWSGREATPCSRDLTDWIDSAPTVLILANGERRCFPGCPCEQHDATVSDNRCPDSNGPGHGMGHPCVCTKAAGHEGPHTCACLREWNASPGRQTTAGCPHSSVPLDRCRLCEEGRQTTPDGWSIHPDVTPALGEILHNMEANLALCERDHPEDERLAAVRAGLRWLLGRRV